MECLLYVIKSLLYCGDARDLSVVYPPVVITCSICGRHGSMGLFLSTALGRIDSFAIKRLQQPDLQAYRFDRRSLP